MTTAQWEPGNAGTVKYAGDATVSGALSQLIELGVEGLTWLAIEMKNTHASVDLSAFQVHFQVGGGAYVTTHSGASDFSTPIAPLTKSFGAPVTLAHTATCILLFTLNKQFDMVRILATGDTATFRITARGGREGAGT